MVIQVRKIVPAAYTAEQGALLFAHIRDALASGDTVVSFDGITTATSSFVNVAFVPLLDWYSLSAIKQRLRVIASTRQINDMIRTRLERVSLLQAA